MYKDLTYETLYNLLITENKSYAKIGEQEGCSGANIKKLAKKLGIPVPVRRKINPKETFNKGNRKHKCCKCCGKIIGSQRVFCSLKCQSDYNYIQWVKRWKDGKETGLKGQYSISNHLRRYLLEKYNYKCSICGWSQENPYTHNIPLEIEHVDGNYQNNSEDNLTVLCPNCHSLTATYKGANRGHGRKQRKKYTI